MSKYKQHLFICTNESGTNNCSQKNSLDLLTSLRQQCKTRFKPDEVRINKSGCLGGCKKGIVAVLYPEGKYYEELGASDGDRLFADISSRIKEDTQ